MLIDLKQIKPTLGYKSLGGANFLQRDEVIAYRRRGEVDAELKLSISNRTLFGVSPGNLPGRFFVNRQRIRNSFRVYG